MLKICGFLKIYILRQKIQFLAASISQNHFTSLDVETFPHSLFFDT